MINGVTAVLNTHTEYNAETLRYAKKRREDVVSVQSQFAVIFEIFGDILAE